jgi:RNA polymerase sigma factor (sigma-70 family)
MEAREDSAATVAGADFELFYQRELLTQVRRAFLLVGSNELAKDIVQEAMVGVFKRWAVLAEPGGYLNRSVINGCHEALRRSGRDKRLVVRLRPQERPAEPTEVLDDVLATLPFNHRAAVVLRYYGGLQTEEIAEALGCAPGSIGPWIDRALKKMRKALS